MFRILQRFFLLVTQHNDLLLAGMVIAIIGLMILPLPTFLVDTLLAINLSVSVILLMMSLYIHRILAFSTFPTLLLLTTLFRLSLNVTTTRLVLTHAYAGEIIKTFGNFMVAGNLVVGAVIFLIITIVQFLVIAKGAERVAEVAARFTLDAMPGKQMSIDADLRAGAVTLEQAKTKRSELERENQLYGAMDGAMKFVKGDAIAGLIITAINIIGGLLIGIFQHNMTLEKALQTYSILTIGDGLVSQIPALLIALTAGIIVTRVSSEDSPALGGDISLQILAQPKAMLVGGVLLFFFAAIPGFPKLQFMVLGLLLFAIGYVVNKVAAQSTKDGDASTSIFFASGPKTLPANAGDSDESSFTVPLIIDIDASLEASLQPDLLNQQLLAVRKTLYHDIGVPFPGVHLRYNEAITGGMYQILLQEIPVAEGRLKQGFVLVRETEDNLNVLGISYTNEKKFLPDAPTIWVKAEDQDLLAKAGVRALVLSEVLTYHLAFVLRKYSADFLGLQETRSLLNNLEEECPEIVKEVQRILPLQKITEVLQRLVQEDISIRNLRIILQAMIDWGQKEKDTVLLVEYVRSSLRRLISYKHSGGQNILAAYLLNPDTEEIVRKAIRQTSGASFLALDPAMSKRIIAGVKHHVGDLSQILHKPVLLTSMDIRRYVKKLIELELPMLPVLSYQELTEEITIQPLAKISI